MRRFLRLPNRIPVRLPERRVQQKWLAAMAIAALATLVAVGWRHTVFISDPMEALDHLLYDQVYKARTPGDRTSGPVVIVAADQYSIKELGEGKVEGVKIAWPWSREIYGDMVKYLDHCGARVVGFDMLFETPAREAQYGTDETFAELLGEVKVPVVFGNQVQPDGQPGPFVIPVKEPVFGAVKARKGPLRVYDPFWYGMPSLAYRLATLYSGAEPARREWYHAHFYGPTSPAIGKTTYRYVSGAHLYAASLGYGEQVGLTGDEFKGKIVLFGATAPGTYDVKATPLDEQFPGVEWQATAIDNLLMGQRVVAVPLWLRIVVIFVASFLVAAGSLLTRRTLAKLGAALAVAGLVILLAVVLFRGETIRWLPLASPVTALILSTLGGLAWSYFTEGRQRQFISKAFALSTSPQIAEAIDRNPEKLKLGGERREITVMFTDLAGFTDLSETMEVVKLAQVINLYMEAMSDEIVKRDGYVDKYIGDAIMSFWNGIVDQPDHAAQTCRAALGIKRRELEIAPELQKLVEARIVTRIGVHTGPMAVGNLGSSRKLAFTVLGDAVNLSARLEPANKLYGSEVLISQVTADQVKGQFVMRELDLLRVKGKQRPMGVFELMAEGEPTVELRARVEWYGEGLAHYRAQRWDDAERVWLKLLKEFPADEPPAAMLKRIPKLRHEELGPNWDGVYVAKEK